MIKTIKNFILNNWRLFIKYTLVGATGTALDVGGFTLLIKYTSLGQTLNTRLIAATCTFIIAVINNFTWNKIWTFKDKQKNIKKQFTKFLTVSIGGLILNITFLTLFSLFFAYILEVDKNALPVYLSAFAKVCASGIVLTYNFTMNRLWTFKPTGETGSRDLGISDQSN